MAGDGVIRKILLDILILLVVNGSFLLLSRLLKPYRRGYFVEDLTIRLPFKPNTVSFMLLTVVGIFVTVITVIITEIVQDNHKKSLKGYILGFAVPRWLWESYIVLGIFAFGASCQNLSVEIAKMAIGRLRPHFYDVCVPISEITLGSYEYITNYTCSLKDRNETRKSFPSGHSSFAMYTAIFLIMYIQNRFTWDGSKLLRHGIQITLLALAWYVCLTRVSDHWHHWDDVATGIIIGVMFAFLTCNHVLKSTSHDSTISLDGEGDMGDD